MSFSEIKSLPLDLFDGKILFFGFDGTLADTERFHAMARNAILKKYGVRVWSWERYAGMTEQEIFTDLDKKFRIGFDISVAVKEKTNLCKSLILAGDVKPFTSVEEIVRFASGKKFVFTVQPYEFTRFFLQRWGYTEHLDKILILNSKFNPDKDLPKNMMENPDDIVLFDNVDETVIDVLKKDMCGILVKEGKFYLCEE